MSALVGLVVLDAFRRDHVGPETPFLAACMRKSVAASLHPPPGFATRTVLFTGQHPASSGNLQAFAYAPEASPFRWMRRLGPLAGLYRARKALFPLRVGVKRASRWASGQHHPDPAWIPGRLLPRFAPVEDARPVFDAHALPATSVFDLCRSHARTFRYLAHPWSGDDADVHRRVLAAYRGRAPPDLLVAQFCDLDERGHAKGPLCPPGLAPPPGQSEQDRETLRDTLRDVDRRCREIHDAMEATGRPYRLLLVGDHGMAPVRRRVDVLGAARRAGLRLGRDVVLLANSTFVNAWYETAGARRRLRDALEALEGGRLLADEERTLRRLAFADRRYGDDLWAADPGTLVWPDHFHVVEHRIRGMHGYLDRREEGAGLLALRGSDLEARELGDRSLLDVFPTLASSLDLPVPATNEGRDLAAHA